MTELTVAICTYKRPALLRTTLQSLAAAERPEMAWELLIIDNAGQASIQSLVNEFAHALPVRYLSEPTLGASHARNRAVNEAAAPIILFTDDDVTFDPRWLSVMVTAIGAHGDCDFWGGQVAPVWPGAQPKWFDTALCPTLGDAVVQYQRGDAPRYFDADNDPPFYTANLALRVARVKDVGLFDTTVGHRGDRRMGMEDSLMVKALVATGSKGWYAAEAIVHHPVPAERLTRRYARGFAWRQGWLSVQLHRTPGSKAPRWFYRVALGQTCAGVGRWIKGVCTGKPALAFAGQFAFVFSFSKLWHAVKSSKAVKQ